MPLGLSRAILLPLAACAVSASAAAQCIPTDVIGHEVRVDAPSSGVRGQRGVLVHADCTSIQLAGGEGDTSVIATRDVSAIAVRVEHRSRALIGAGLGLVVGALPPLIAWAGCGEGTSSGAFTCEGGAAVVALVTVPAGVILGAGIGAMLGIDAWRPVDVGSVMVGIVPRADGLGAMVRIGF